MMPKRRNRPGLPEEGLDEPVIAIHVSHRSPTGLPQVSRRTWLPPSAPMPLVYRGSSLNIRNARWVRFGW